MKNLYDEFCNDELDHFSNYDYVLQLNTNGQFSAYKEFIKELSNNALLTLLKNNDELKESFKDELKEEILKRMK